MRGRSPAYVFALGILLCLPFWTRGAGALEWPETPIGDASLTGKIYTQAALRTQHSHGYTFPETNAGDLVQHRNFLQAEFKNVFSRELSFFFSTRIVYEGLYDYGPEKFEPYGHKGNDLDDGHMLFDNLLVDFREGYLDINRGPIFMRIGRQNLSWGEADLFRLLDQINPLDNTFGFLEDFDERRIPLDMIRLDLDFGNAAFVQGLLLEGFVALGKVQAPIAAYGTPFSAPLPATPIEVRLVEARQKEVRGGLRLMGLTRGVNWSLGHYWTYPDAPGGRFAFSRPGDALSLYQEIKFNREMITGGSFSFFTGLDTTQTMARGEFAYAWDEKMFDPVKNTPFGPTTIFVPPLGYIPLPFGPQEGTYPDAGILRWVLGLDNNIWIRFLNHKNTFLVSAQVYGQHILHNWSETYRLALPIYGKTDPLSPDYYVKLHKNEYQATLMINTYYMDGDLVPQIALAADYRNAWYLEPSIKYRYGNFELLLKYQFIDGNFTGIGIFRDRDQALMRITYLFP